MNIATTPNRDASSSSRVPTVLVVDDSKAQCRLLARTLEKWGYAAIEATSGADALEICRSMVIEYVVSDWLMPGMSGIEFCREFRELSRDRAAYFILLTAQTDRETLALGLENGADDFLSKPFNAIELKARLRAGQRIVKAQRALEHKNTELAATLEQLEADLNQARVFQQSLVPERNVRLDKAEISILFRPSGHVGGDLVGYFPVSEGRLGLYSIDVSGHGVASALMTARVAAHLSATTIDQNIALTSRNGSVAMRQPDEVCRHLNSLIQAETETDLYLTMVLADVDLAKGRVRFCQAGHTSPAIVRQDGEIEFLEEFGMPIGLVDDIILSTRETPIHPGDQLFLYSDGLTECPAPDGTLFEETGLATILQSRQSGLGLMTRIEHALEDYSGLSNFPDDLSAIMLEVHQ